MLKPDSLRARLTAAFPDHFGKDAQRLQLWIEEGHVRCHAGEASLNFTVEYKLSVSITGWTLPSLMIWAVLIDWLRLQQPDLLTPAKSRTAIPFEADLTSNSDVDIGFDLMLTEPVLMVKREDGGFDMRVQAEPDPLFPAEIETSTVPLLPEGSVLKTIWAPDSANPAQLVPPTD